MVYVDTSALVPMFMREPRTEAVIRWLESSNEGLAVSEWGLVEFASAASMKVRAGAVSKDLSRRAMAKMSSFAHEHCLVAVPGQEDFRRAAELSGDDTLNVRAGDALHLAVTQRLNARGLLCLDQAMTESARILGIEVMAV